MYPGVTAAVVALAANVVYVVSLHREGDLGSSRVQFVAASVTAAALAAAFGARSAGSRRFRFALVNAAAFTLLAWGVLAVFSIGFPLFVAGGFALVAAERMSSGLGREAYLLAVLGGLAGTGLVALGLITTG